MPSLLTANNAYSTLAGSISDVAVSLSVQAGHGARFPNPTGGDWFFVTLQDASNNIEIVKVTARSTDTLTVVRGQEGTTPRAWASNDVVELRLTAGTAVTTDGTQTMTNKTLGTGTVVSTASVTGEVTNSATSSFQMPAGTDGQRPTGAAGKFRFNTTVGKFEGHNGTSWGSVGGGATGAGGDDVFVENGTTVTTSYTLSTNKNAMSVGPISVNGGAVITVPSGQRWVVL